MDETFETAYVKSKDHEFHAEEWKTDEWEEIKKNPMPNGRSMPTGLSPQKLKEIGLAISTLPAKGEWHRQIKKIFEQNIWEKESSSCSTRPLKLKTDSSH